MLSGVTSPVYDSATMARLVDDGSKEELSPTKADPLLDHLKAKYKQQRNKQIAEMKRNIERDHSESTEKNIHEILNPSLELLSDFAILLMNELETLCIKNNLDRGVELVREIRVITNNEIRQAVSVIENGYTSGFQNLQRQAAFKLDALVPIKSLRVGRGGGAAAPPPPSSSSLVPGGRTSSSSSTLSSSGRGGGGDVGAGRIGGGRSSYNRPRVGEHTPSPPPPSSTMKRGILAGSHVSSTHRLFSRSGSGETGEATEWHKSHKDALRSCPKDWKANMKQMVVDELFYQKGITPSPERKRLHPSHKEKQFSLQECCSAVPAFFAESLASLLVCEVVRIYLYDNNKNLHCCSSYPYHAFQGDPMHGTYKEIMLAKDFHSMVCSELMAVNGYESWTRSNNTSNGNSSSLIHHIRHPFSPCTKEGLPSVSNRKTENKDEDGVGESGWSSIRSCLLFPIIPLIGARKNALGMIHCVNKVAVSSKEPGAFTSDDEVLCSMASRLLGCMLTRYPVTHFSLRVGEMLRKAVFPLESTHSIDDHLQDRLTDIVENAAEAGQRAMVAPVPILILRAPLSEIDPSKEKRARARKIGTLGIQDSTLSSVEFNIRSVNELWQTGMEENIIMHQQYRKLEESMQRTKLLLQNILDGLAAARSMRRAEEITMYLQTIELFGRSESVEMLSEFISETLIGKMNQNSGRKLLFPELSFIPASAMINRDSVLIQVENTSQTNPPGTQGPQSITSWGPNKNSPSQALVPPPPQTTKIATGTGAGGQGMDSKVNQGMGAGASEEQECYSAFLTPAEMDKLQHHHQLINARVASRIHADGPDSIRCYSCDPAKKREQMLFIDQMMEEGIKRSKALNDAESGIRRGMPGYLHSTRAMSAKKVNSAHPLLHRSVSQRNKNISFGSSVGHEKNRPFLLR